MNFGFNSENMQQKMPPPEIPTGEFENPGSGALSFHSESVEDVEKFELGNMRAGEEVVVETASGSKYRIRHPGGSAGELLVYHKTKDAEADWVVQGIVSSASGMLIEAGKSLVLPLATGGTGEGKILKTSAIKTIVPRG